MEWWHFMLKHQFVCTNTMLNYRVTKLSLLQIFHHRPAAWSLQPLWCHWSQTRSRPWTSRGWLHSWWKCPWDHWFHRLPKPRHRLHQSQSDNLRRLTTQAEAVFLQLSISKTFMVQNKRGRKRKTTSSSLCQDQNSWPCTMSTLNDLLSVPRDGADKTLLILHKTACPWSAYFY